MRTSSPFAVPPPEILIPKRHVTASILLMLVGVPLVKEAIPPEMENEKSLASRSPLAPLVLKTSSENRISTLLLSLLDPTTDMVGARSSVKFAVNVLIRFDLSAASAKVFASTFTMEL